MENFLYLCSVIIYNDRMRNLKILYSEEVNDFLSELAEKPKRKILYNMGLIAGGKIDNELFKKLANTDIWEFRTCYSGVWYRLLAFWDTGALIVTTHGFCKKSNKTPQKEIDKAIAIRKEYFNQKKSK